MTLINDINDIVASADMGITILQACYCSGCRQRKVMSPEIRMLTIIHQFSFLHPVLFIHQVWFLHRVSFIHRVSFLAAWKPLVQSRGTVSGSAVAFCIVRHLV